MSHIAEGAGLIISFAGRVMKALVIVSVLAVGSCTVAVGVAGYLTYQHYQDKPLTMKAGEK